MKVATTFWSDVVHEFDELLYINGETKEVMFRADLNDSFDTYRFFKSIAKFVRSAKCLKSLLCGNEWFQFAIVRAGQTEHIKWFDLVINDKVTVSHDIAFETTMVTRNGIRVPFGQFPMWNKKRLPKYREFSVKARVYGYMANQVWRNK